MDFRENWIGPYVPQGNLIRELIQQARLAYDLILDSRVHPVTKLIPLAALGYLLLPPDVVPDFLPVLGQLDDVAVVLFSLRLFFEFSPEEVVREHLQRLVRRTKGDWTVVEETGGAGTAQQGEVVDED